jgi:hypothetical protein
MRSVDALLSLPIEIPFDQMPLSQRTNEYIGRTLFVMPYYGNGWVRADLGKPPPEPHGSLGPAPFRARVEKMIICNGQLMGAMATIDETGHPFDGHWCCFYLRSTEECDFAGNQGHYMIWIAPKELPLQSAPEKPLYQWVTPDPSTSSLCGYGMVAESKEFMGEFYEITMATRRRVLGSC